MKKVSATETTVFVYDGGGQLVAEYSSQANPTASVKYLTQDHLGSPRIITDQNGAVVSRTDFGAFGDETFTPQRTAGLGYSAADGVRQDYTGYQKDDESGLEFAQARYYNPAHGRFTSPDPLTASASIRDPQTFNRYSYALNSPYKFTDPLGLISSSTGACGQFCKGGIDGGGGFSPKSRDDENPDPLPAPEAHTNEAAQPAEAVDERSHETAQTAQPQDQPPQSGTPSQPNEKVDSTTTNSDSGNVANVSQTRLVGPFVLPRNVVDDLVAGSCPSQGNGDCAQLPQILLSGEMGLTREWVAGQNVADFEKGPPRGTVIATFNEEGRYPGANTGNHVAIFLRFETTKNGQFVMKVVNQWIGLSKPKVSTIRFPNPNTPLPKVPSAAAIKDARTYRVVLRSVPN